MFFVFVNKTDLIYKIDTDDIKEFANFILFSEFSIKNITKITKEVMFDILLAFDIKIFNIDYQDIVIMFRHYIDIFESYEDVHSWCQRQEIVHLLEDAKVIYISPLFFFLLKFSIDEELYKYKIADKNIFKIIREFYI